MQQPSEFKKASSCYYSLQKEFFNEFASQFNWKPNGLDSMLDIGCGPGDLTINFIEPLLPANYDRLIGLDLSHDMINYAKMNFKKPKIDFIQCDIEHEISDAKLKWLGLFDHVITVKTLMWLSDLEFAFKNIYKLLKPQGDFAFSYYYKSSLSDSFVIMSQSTKWKPYYKGISKGRMHLTANLEECLDYLKTAGFTPMNYKVNQLKIEHSIESYKALVNAIDPVINKLPKDLREEYLSNMMDLAITFSERLKPETENGKITIYADEIVGYARK